MVHGIPTSKPRTALDVIVGARALLADKSRWCRGASARSWRGHAVPPSDPQAKAFCIYGAIRRASAGNARLGTDACELVERHLRLSRRTGNVAEFNDTASHADMLALLDFQLTSLPQVFV